MAAHTVVVFDWSSFSQAEVINRAYRTNRYQGLQRVLGLASQLLSAVRGGAVKIQHCASASVCASNTVTYDYTSLDADDTLTIGGVELTAKASGANGTTQWNIGASNALGTAALTACVNANTTLSKYFVATNPTATTVVITALMPGGAYNMIACTVSDSGGTALADATFTGGVGMDYATVSTFTY